MKNKATKKNKVEKVHKVGLVREDGWLYFIDKDGDISRMWVEHKKKVEDDEQG